MYYLIFAGGAQVWGSTFKSEEGTMLSYIGERVVRGPDWEYNDDDGGDGCVGTVIGQYLSFGSCGRGFMI